LKIEPLVVVAVLRDSRVMVAVLRDSVGRH